MCMYTCICVYIYIYIYLRIYIYIYMHARTLRAEGPSNAGPPLEAVRSAGR